MTIQAGNGRRYAANYFKRPTPLNKTGGNGIYLAFDASHLLTVIEQTQQEGAKIKEATLLAHLKLAKRLQLDIAAVLARKVRARGRLQGADRSPGSGGNRIKPEESRLGAAIKSERNRKVTQRGFTVGYLDSIDSVARYYRNLEVGSSIFVGRYLSGVFLPGGGEFVKGGAKGKLKRGRLVFNGAMRLGYGKDAQFIQRHHFRYDRPFEPGVKIRNPIPAYRYFSQGEQKFIKRGGTREMALKVYKTAFRETGFILFEQALQDSGSKILPQRSSSDLRGDDI